VTISRRAWSNLKVNSLDSEIRGLKCGSDIAIDGDAYAEILTHLSQMDLNLAFFVFHNRTHSSSARRVEGGGAETFPTLTLYLKHNEDFRKTGVDPHRGNWDDEWEQTDSVRDAVNSVLRRHSYGPDSVSDGTFVFLDTVERIAFDHIGRASKVAVHELVRRETGGKKPSHVFWSSDGVYHIVMKNKRGYRRLADSVKQSIAGAVPEVLAKADSGGYCKDYGTRVEFAYQGMKGLNLAGLARED
jgi:hypothetical protein